MYSLQAERQPLSEDLHSAEGFGGLFCPHTRSIHRLGAGTTFRGFGSFGIWRTPVLPGLPFGHDEDTKSTVCPSQHESLRA